VPEVPGFIGGSAQAASRSLDVERTVNLMTIYGDSGTPKVPATLQNAPRCQPWMGMPVGPIRGLYSLNGQRGWGVCGPYLYELFANQTASLIGTMAADNRPATFACNGANGNQLLIASGYSGYVFDLVTGDFQQVDADPLSGFPAQCAMVAECAGYGLALSAQSNQFNVSAPVDFSSWDSLDFGRVQTNDPLVSMIAANNLVYLLGGQQSQIWYPSGQNFPFSPVQNVQLETGTSSPFGAIALGVSPNATVVFPSKNREGQGVLYALNGYSPQPVSSFSISTIFQKQARLDNLIAWSYQENRHTYGMFYLPSNDTTLVFDVDAPPGMNWTERGIWDSAQVRFVPHVGRCHMFCFGKHLVGARNSGTIYEMSSAFYTDRIVA
jgi:hypothetical protein